MIGFAMYDLPYYDEFDVLHYAGIRHDDPELDRIFMHRVMDECTRYISIAKVCYLKLPVAIDEDNNIKLGDVLEFKSADLAKSLEGSTHAYIFAATIGLQFDKEIQRWSSIDTAKTFWMEAIGTERVETLANEFCKELALKPRFSPGYGDLPLELQADLIRILEANDKLGLYLNESMVMSPSKSITAIAGCKY